MVESRAIHSQPATLANIQPPKVLNHCLFYLHVYCAPTTKKNNYKKNIFKKVKCLGFWGNIFIYYS